MDQKYFPSDLNKDLILVNPSIINPNSNITIKYPYRSIIVIPSGNITWLVSQNADINH